MGSIVRIAIIRLSSSCKFEIDSEQKLTNAQYIFDTFKFPVITKPKKLNEVLTFPFLVIQDTEGDMFARREQIINYEYKSRESICIRFV